MECDFGLRTSNRPTVHELYRQTHHAGAADHEVPGTVPVDCEADRWAEGDSDETAGHQAAREHSAGPPPLFAHGPEEEGECLM